MNRTSRGIVAAARVVVPMLLILAVSGCDSVTEPPEMDARAPVVGDLVLFPPAVSIDTLSVTDEGYRIPLDLSLTARPGDAPLQRVAYAVQWQFVCQPGVLEAAGDFEMMGENRYAAVPELTLPRGRRGAFRVTTWAVDATGRLSNEAATTLTIAGTNLGPPVITSIEAPAQITPPATLRFLVVVDDPDGIDHIARAEVAVPGSGTLPMSDTDTAGNNRVCDGRYSAAFNVPRGIEPGLITFTFRAFDRDGAASEPVDFTVEIRPS